MRFSPYGIVQVNRKLIALLATTIGSSAVILDGTIVNMALPKISGELHTGFSSLQWITDGYLLSLSALILLGGSLGDVFGRKRVYLIGLLGFGISSMLCALAPSVQWLIAARVLQGIFGALMVPGALAIINTTFDAKGRGQAIGRWTAWSSIAVVLAPFAGGWILQLASWRWIFFVNIPLVTLCFILAWLSVKETKDSRVRTIDTLGAMLVTLSLAGMTYGLIEGPARQWPAFSLVSIVAGAALGVWFVLHERRAEDPMVQLSLFASRNFTGANIMTFLMYGALGGFTFALVIYLQSWLHYSALHAGLTLLPISALMLLFASRTGKMATVYGPRPFMTAGPLVAAAGMMLLFFLKPGDGYLLGVLPGVLLFGVGLVLLVAPLTTTVMASVNEESSGVASGINNAVARVAGLIVIAVLGFFGAAHMYQFALGLCVVLAVAAGIVSFVMIEKLPGKRLKAVGRVQE